MIKKKQKRRYTIRYPYSLCKLTMTCLFCQISHKTLPAPLVFEDTDLIAVSDIRPQAPVHLLIIPKQHIATLNDLSVNEAPLVGKMVLCAQQLAIKYQIHETGYRLVFNANADGGQTVYHIHLHLLGGRSMTWPPG